jgi:integrase
VWAADLQPETQERYRRLGRERALLYKTAVLTGLRQGELAALRVAYLKLDRKPVPALELPGEFTKNGDDAKLLLVPALADELRQWVADTGKKPTDLLFTVSGKANKISAATCERRGSHTGTTSGGSPTFTPFATRRTRCSGWPASRRSCGNCSCATATSG